MKQELGIEEDISIERVHCTGKIQRNDGTRNKKRTIDMKILSFKGKSRILHNYREKKLWKEKIFVNEGFFEETDSIRKGLLQRVKDLRSENKLVKVAQGSLNCPQVKNKRL